MKKHYILVWIEQPDESYATLYGSWQTVKSTLTLASKAVEDIQKIGPTAWLVLRDHGLPFVADCIERARTNNLKCHTMFLQSDD